MTAKKRLALAGLARSLAISCTFSLIIGLVIRPAGAPVWVTTLLFGIPFGLSFFGVDYVVGSRLRHRSFLVTLLLQGLSVWLIIGVNFSFATLMLTCYKAGLGPWDPQVLGTVGYVLQLPMVQGSALVTFFFVLLISSVFQVSQKLGPGVLWGWLTGRYHEPHEEERIFMFLDMKDSTTLAERLGAIRFSALVRDFMQDLTMPVLETRGEVSHYIGDEAVLTWRMERGLREGNCVRVHFLMKRAIAERAPHYMKQYGLVPEFKAGVHCGPVVATEVGQIKSEIVFHGDVLNTTARIQGMCNAFGEELLVSDELLSQLTLPAGLHAKELGRHLLKGKEHDVGIIAVRDAREPMEEMPRGSGSVENAMVDAVP